MEACCGGRAQGTGRRVAGDLADHVVNAAQSNSLPKHVRRAAPTALAPFERA